MNLSRNGDNNESAPRMVGYRVTDEPSARRQPRTTSPSPPPSRGPTPTEWRAAEAELQAKTRLPFDPTSTPRTTERRRPALFPTVGRTFQAVGGAAVEIGRILAQDGPNWFVADTTGRRYTLRRVLLAWHALPPDPFTPVPGDIIVHRGGESELCGVLGEAVLGGWAVSSSSGAIHHVMHSDANRWVSVSVVDT